VESVYCAVRTESLYNVDKFGPSRVNLCNYVTYVTIATDSVVKQNAENYLNYYCCVYLHEHYINISVPIQTHYSTHKYPLTYIAFPMLYFSFMIELFMLLQGG
jgi:hypothetical protein